MKLGTNKSLSEQGERDSTIGISLEQYFNPEGSLKPGYMFITGLHRHRLNRFESALVNDASETIRQWQQGAALGPYLNDDAAGAVGVGGLDAQARSSARVVRRGHRH